MIKQGTLVVINRTSRARSLHEFFAGANPAGFRFKGICDVPVLMPAPAGCTGTGTNYYATAAPLSTSTGSRAFATDEQGTIWQNNAAPPVLPTQPFTVGANTTPIQ